MGPFHRNALLPPDDNFYGHLRVITPDEATAPRGRVIDPETVQNETYVLREYPLEMAETGELYGVAPSPSRWRTEVRPAHDPWQTKVFRPNGLLVR
jgi:hypothetical protein